jgi:hypothetical protein
MTNASRAIIALFIPILFPLAACTRTQLAEPPPRSDTPPASAVAVARPGMTFTDLRGQTAEFIEYYNTIKLTPEQEKVKTAALTSIPAPCCSSFSAATCCCACNFSKSLWGLTSYLIAKEGRSVDEVKSAALSWIAFTHPNGSSGKACSSGRCNRSFAEDGCGGMQDSDLRL